MFILYNVILRESQQQWFGKRGLSIFGIMQTILDQTSGSKKTIYYIFISEDSTQDTTFVNSCLVNLLTKVAPQSSPFHTLIIESDFP